MSKGSKLTEEQKIARRKARRALAVALEWQDLDDFEWVKARRELGEYLAALQERDGSPPAPTPETEAFCAQLRTVVAEVQAERAARIAALRSTLAEAMR